MALIIPPGYAQVVMTFYADSTRTGEWVTTFGIGEELGPEPTSLQAAAQTIYDAVQVDLLPQMNAATGIRSVEVFNDDDSAMVVGDDAGLRTGALPPPNVAVLVDKNTSRRGRRAQGRMYLYGFANEDEISDGGFLGTATRTSIQEALTDFEALVEGFTGSPMVILQNSEGISPPLTPPPVIASLDVAAQVATQRRRMRR
jgi:hypothetical protein